MSTTRRSFSYQCRPEYRSQLCKFSSEVHLSKALLGVGCRGADGPVLLRSSREAAQPSAKLLRDAIADMSVDVTWPILTLFMASL